MSVSETALVDTGFWIALFDPQEDQHEVVGENDSWLDLATVVVPWPVLYETVRTRFVRHPEWLQVFDQRLKKPNVVFIDDAPYCQEAYELSVDFSTRLKRPISMVDMLCRLLIDDPNVRIDYMLTTNPGDFHDVCRTNSVELLVV